MEYDDETNDEHESKHCLVCRKRINIGEDIIEVEQGVLGFRGTVPLEDRQAFCSRRCARKYLDGNGHDDEDNRPPVLPGKRQIP